jgi:hypothetical protein
MGVMTRACCKLGGAVRGKWPVVRTGRAKGAASSSTAARPVATRPSCAAHRGCASEEPEGPGPAAHRRADALYGKRTVRVIAEGSDQRAFIKSVDDEGRTFRGTVKWANLADFHDQLF